MVTESVPETSDYLRVVTRLSAREVFNVLDNLVPSMVFERRNVEVSNPPEDQIMHVDFNPLKTKRRLLYLKIHFRTAQ